MRVLLPLPDRDFDVTEVAVPWAILRDAGHQVVFATEKAGTVPAADPRLLTGVLFGQLGAAAEARKLYYELIGAAEFGSTVAWADLDPGGFDGLILPGGHAPGMRQYLGSPVLSEQVGRFWRLNRPVGAICHGVLVLARTRDPATGRSVLASRRTTCLPKYMERSAYLATAWRLGRYYRTIPPTSRTRCGPRWRTRTASSSAGRSRCPRAAPPPATARPSSSTTATTYRPAGQVTRTCSAARSATCSKLNVCYSERTGLSAVSTGISPCPLAAFPPR